RVVRWGGRRGSGVMAVLVGEDYLADDHIGMAHLPNPADAHDVTMPSFQPTAECKILDLLHLPLAVDCVRFVGEPVALVVAETLAAAGDAAAAVAARAAGPSGRSAPS